MAGQQDNDYSWRQIHGSVPYALQLPDDILEVILVLVLYVVAGVH